MKPSLLHELVEGTCEAVGDAAAVADGDRIISYGDLERRANQVARLLVEIGVRGGDRVGLCLDKSLEAVIALYGVLKAGAAYVPLDPQAPPARLAYITRDCGVRCLLTRREEQHRCMRLVDHGAPLKALVIMDAAGPDVPAPGGARVFDGSDIDVQDPSRPRVRGISIDLAYVLYTSGSTGDPKGVMLSHLNALTFVDWATVEFGVGVHDRVASHAPFHFDLSVFDIFVSAAAGASLVLVPSTVLMFPVELRRFLEATKITVSYSVPSVLARLTARGRLRRGDLSDLRLVLFAGEVFPVKYLQRLMDLLPGTRFANLYGPTETNVCTWWDVPPLEPGRVEPIPIGQAIGNVEVFAMTDDGRRAAIGEIGELYVRGATVTKGYWSDEARTAAALVPDPFRSASTERVYRTGDFVQELDDGNYKFIGRRDSQIKSRGYRIELGEIEAALDAHPDVVESAVVAVPDELVSNRIKAYVVGSGVDGAVLAAFCAERMPRYMVPESFECRDTLPRTSTGKVDRQALMRLAASPVDDDR